MNNNLIKYHFNKQFFSKISCCGIFLHQIGDLAFYESGFWPEHGNNYYEFTYVLDGKGTVYTGEHVCPVETGDCVLTVPGKKHSIVSSPGTPLRYAFTSFAADVQDQRYAELFDSLQEIQKQNQSRCIHNTEMQKPLFRLIQEIQNNAPFQQMQMGNLLVDLIICYLRSAKHITLPTNYDITDKMLLAYRIQDHLQKNFLNTAKVTDLEEIFHYKYNSLEMLFKNIYGITISQYLTTLRMEKATQLYQKEYPSAGSVRFCNIPVYTLFLKVFGIITGSRLHDISDTVRKCQMNRVILDADKKTRLPYLEISIFYLNDIVFYRWYSFYIPEILTPRVLKITWH